MPAQRSLNDDQELSLADQVGVAPDVTRERHREAGASLPTRRIPLGEELPIFCERCGYCLHGMAQQVCERCTIRQFHCPECGHHQPINTLRPAAQKMLGRIRAFFLTLSVIFKINFFGWLLFAWVMMGFEWSYGYNRGQAYSVNSGVVTSSRAYSYRHGFGPREADVGQIMAFALFGLFFGMASRMLLLRWRRGFKIGLILSALICVAICFGAMWRKMDREAPGEPKLPQPFTQDFLVSIVTAVLALMLGASIIWGIWSALAHVFLPRRTSEALLEWQRSQSNPSAALLGRD
jgi:hypothetical protein